jgi:tetratricopeptide (TPR) repeat protein
MGNTDWASVGRRIRRLRHERGLTQADVSGGAMSHAYVSQIEAGRRRPSPKMLRVIAAQLGVTDDYLLTGRDPGGESKLRVEIETARLAIHQGRSEDALTTLRRVIKTAHEYSLDEAEASAHEVYGAGLHKQGRFEDAIDAYDEAVRLLEGAPVERRCGAVVGRAKCLFLMGDVRYAIHVLESYLLELKQRPAADPTALASVHSALIGPYFKSGLIEQARDAAEKARRLSVRVSDPEVVGCMNVNLAGVYLGDGRPDDALRALERAEQSFRQLEWTDEGATTRIAQAMGHIEKEDWDEARKHLLQALGLLEDSPHVTTRAAALNQLGRVERITGDVGAATEHLTEALGLVADGNLNERGLAQRELALCAAGQGDLQTAGKLLLDAIDTYRRSSNAPQVGLTFLTYGDLEVQRGDHGAALTLYREGLEAATRQSL